MTLSSRSLPALLCIITGIVSATVQAQEGFDPNAKLPPDFKLTPFYDAGLDYLGKKPGEVVRIEAVPAPAGANAWRVMYVSRTWDDRLVPLTGLVVAPKEPGSKPRPVLNWLHGTTGGSRTSAPSLAENPAQNLVQRSDTAPVDYGVPYLTDFLKRGYVVVATDYYGQGGPGVHQYVVGSTAARNGLDLVRAARSLKDVNAGVDLFTFGWSQGGHAALFTGEEQAAYAPELTHRGVVAIAPGTTLFPDKVNIPHLYLLMRGYHDAYGVSLDDFTAEGKRLITAAGDVSVMGVFQLSLTMKGPFFSHGWNPEMKKALAINVPGNRKSPTPILVVHGEDDKTVSPDSTKELEPRAIKHGNEMKVSWYPGKGHRTVIEPAKGEILEWMATRMK